MEITDKEFAQFQTWVYQRAGITLGKEKKSLVMGRLMKRVSHYELRSFSAYFDLLHNGQAPAEPQVALDLLTTNETYFFREPKHFTFLAKQVLSNFRTNRPFRVWSAACSSGEEPYSIAMLLADHLGDRAWEIVASDISTRVLAKARSGHYAIERAEHIPPAYLSEYCLKGVGAQQGTFLIQERLRKRMQFMPINLNADLPDIGRFDVIFLRNVMIYFNLDTKAQVVRRLARVLEPEGHFFIGHSETLNGIQCELASVQPAIYSKP